MKFFLILVAFFLATGCNKSNNLGAGGSESEPRIVIQEDSSAGEQDVYILDILDPPDAGGDASKWRAYRIELRDVTKPLDTVEKTRTVLKTNDKNEYINFPKKP